jgi:hypothetical protein
MTTVSVAVAGEGSLERSKAKNYTAQEVQTGEKPGPAELTAEPG